MAKITKVEPLPAWVEVAGISVGGCITTHRRIQCRGHAHNNTKNKDYGWICLRTHRGLKTLPNDGTLFDESLFTPNKVALHEYAHILAPNHGHGKAWKVQMKKLKQSVPRRYEWLTSANTPECPCGIARARYAMPIIPRMSGRTRSGNHDGRLWRVNFQWPWWELQSRNKQTRERGTRRVVYRYSEKGAAMKKSKHHNHSPCYCRFCGEELICNCERWEYEHIYNRHSNGNISWHPLWVCNSTNSRLRLDVCTTDEEMICNCERWERWLMSISGCCVSCCW